MTSNSCHRGFMLITVLIVTAVGLLFGAGALLLFRYQCQLRIDRQHELEKVYAVRSVLNYIRTGNIPVQGKDDFLYPTRSGRSLRLIARPVEPIFPDTNYVDNIGRHFVMEYGDFNKTCPHAFCNSQSNRYCRVLDYEYGASDGITNVLIRSNREEKQNSSLGLAFTDMEVTNNVKWWVNIGMRGTGGWLQDDYGRRYWFYLRDQVSGTSSSDVIRLCLIRNVTNEYDAAGNRLAPGCRHGWPLSQNGERAVVFQIVNDRTRNVREMTLWEYEYMKEPQLRVGPKSTDGDNVGMQLAQGKASLFYIENASDVENNVDVPLRGFEISDVESILGSSDYFATEQQIGGKTYPGITNVNGKVLAPELRAVFEVEASLDVRTNLNFVTNFRVTPAYQYDVFVEHPSGSAPKRATVAQKIGKYARPGWDPLDYSILTYDTHGTEHKGFRRDERDWAREQLRKNGK